MEMQLQAQPMMSCSGGPSAPSQTLPSGGAYMGGYNSPFHLARGPESHSYSSGYSSQQVRASISPPSISQVDCLLSPASVISSNCIIFGF